MQAFTLCFVGRSGSGKTTIAQALEVKLTEMGIDLQVLDGDVLRSQLGNMFGYTREERMKQSRVNIVLAKYLNEHHVSVLLSMVGAYEEMRRELRAYMGESYIQIFVQCSFEECARRDVKGYYKKCQSGDMENFNGSSDVYEDPEDSEIIVNTECESLERCIQKILVYLEKKHYV